MARLTKTEKHTLQAQWLASWRQAKSPRMTRDNLISTITLAGKDGERFEDGDIFIEDQDRTVQQRFGMASLLKVWAGGHDITFLVARLAGLRLRKDGTVGVRSGCGRQQDMWTLALMVVGIHSNAAFAHLDQEAFGSLDCEEVARFERAALNKAVSVGGGRIRRRAL